MDEKKKGQSTVDELKTKGNECVKDGKFIEAVLHYTQAIKMDPSNYVLYSNRSFAFLKLDQHYLSLQDANETVRLQPQWAKGYFRRAEVEAASELYDEAILSYTRALTLEPHDVKLLESIKDISEKQKKKIQSNKNIIWICTLVGLVFGIAIIVLDTCFTSKPTLIHPLSMIAFSTTLGAIGFAVGKTVEMMSTMNAGKSLEPPSDLGFSDNTEEKENIPDKKAKYSKAQARQRYKQGKL